MARDFLCNLMQIVRRITERRRQKREPIIVEVAKRVRATNFDTYRRSAAGEDFAVRLREAWQLGAEIRGRWLLPGGWRDSWRQAAVILLRAYKDEGPAYALPNELRAESENFLKVLEAWAPGWEALRRGRQQAGHDSE
eukprot:6265903-Alexandrium_andersonii.AAC.1